MVAFDGVCRVYYLPDLLRVFEKYSKLSPISVPRFQDVRIFLVPFFAEFLFVEHFPKQVILLSDTLEAPTMDSLWNYLSHFYDKVGKELRNLFEFKDATGVFTENDKSRLFAICVKYN